MTDELHSGLHLHLFVQMRTNVRQPQKYSLPLSILNRIVLLSQGLCPRIPTTFEKVDKTFCFCPNEGDWLKEPDLRESEAFKFALNRLRETALVLSQTVPGSAC